jgi:Flp pilus assembly protein TadG
VKTLRLFKSKTSKRRGESGATAVEFAMVALPFFAMMFALFEIMMIFFVQTTLEAAVAEEARKIRTGQAQSTTAPISKSQFKAGICTRLYGMGDCTNRLFVMVQSFSTNPTGPLPLPWTDGTLTPGSNDDEPYDANWSSCAPIMRGP